MNKRLLSLDVMRGITIAGMILVNNPGDWGNIYAPLKHADWNGLTPTDLVFPFFMFIMGVSTYISMSKFNFEFSRQAALKIVKRTLVIYAVGLALAWLGLSLGSLHTFLAQGLSGGELVFKSFTRFEHLRLLGVLPRLAITYGIAALIALWVRPGRIPYIAASLLLFYAVILLAGNGYAPDESSILSVVDRALLGTAHMYYDQGIDPEGVLSTIPAVAHVLIGFLCGQILMRYRDDKQQLMLKLFIVGALLTFAGFLLSYALPINKKIWSPTFVLATTGMAATLLSLLVWAIDVKGYKRWTSFFEAFGANPLFIYVLADIVNFLFYNIIFTYQGQSISLKTFLYSKVFYPVLGAEPASLLFALLFVSICWLVARVLYVRKVYIKI